MTVELQDDALLPWRSLWPQPADDGDGPGDGRASTPSATTSTIGDPEAVIAKMSRSCRTAT
jgi:hypothetical protein